jgi:murein DD-endopeptidase MepM/ murein hydrolase activator NlpD
MRACRAWVAPVVAAAVLVWSPRAARSGGASWSYLLPVDHGIRVDGGGKGHFLASRHHGKHNGLDILAPIGTPVRASCSGSARGGSWGSFGHWVQLVCKLPTSLTQGEVLYASLFHAHLQRMDVPHGDWVQVQAGQRLGTVGKTGNARAGSIMPHVHLEVIVHASEEAARAERHSGRDQSDTEAADHFFRHLAETCLGPRAFTSDGDMRRTRRFDPFVVLACADADKPAFTLPAPPLRGAAQRWSATYHADAFDPDGER